MVKRLLQQYLVASSSTLVNQYSLKHHTWSATLYYYFFK